MLWQQPTASAQDTGVVQGEVRVCSLNVDDERVDESPSGVAVYMIKINAPPEGVHH